jgi:hypothetical protein
MIHFFLRSVHSRASERSETVRPRPVPTAVAAALLVII